VDEIVSPFSDSQVQALNEWQSITGIAPTGHPFTCRNQRDQAHQVAGLLESVLIATPCGWVCPCCDYTQDWAFAGMAEPKLPHWVTEDMWSEMNEITKGNAREEIAVYQRLADAGAKGASVMVRCLERVLERTWQKQP
jgi:hypothetical protein